MNTGNNMQMQNRELGWEDTIQNDGQDFEPLPAGDYDVTIEKFDRARSSGQGKLPPCNMAIVTFIVHGPDRDVPVRENYILHTALEWKLSELFCGVGLKKKGEELRMNWSLLPGKKARAKVGLEPGMKDQTKMYNRIEKLYPYEAPKYTAGSF